MNYSECVAYIESLAPTILNPSLERFALFMNEHQRLQDNFPTIHIGGTNGKGSTVAIVDSVLRASGLRVGRFTGPHLLRWNERFHFDGQPISDETFTEYASRLKTLSEEFAARHPEFGTLTWFEFLTAIAFFYFADKKVDVAVFEVGLGGRWDATNVLSSPLVSSITTIDLDHTHILGETVGEIAREKAGIIKPNVPVVTATNGEALDQIRGKSEQQSAPLYVCRAPDAVSGPHPIDLQAYRNAKSQLALPGHYQQLNGLLAAVILQLADQRLHKNVSSFLAKGFSHVYWPGRLQYLPDANLVFDGAHNVAGARALRQSLDELFPGRNRVFVLSFFQNKNVSGALSQLVRPEDEVFVSEAHTTRAVSPAGEVVEFCRSRGVNATACPTIPDALRSARTAAGTGRLVVVSGSFATIKESMLALGWKAVEDGVAQTWRPGGISHVGHQLPAPASGD